MFSNDSTDSFSSDLRVTESIKTKLRTVAQWGTFLSIIGFIMVGLIFLIGLGMMILGNNIEMLTNGLSPVWIGWFYLVLGIIYIFPIYYLYQFSRKMKDALLTNNELSLEESFSYLKTHYQFIGVLAIIGLCFWILGIVSMIVLMSAYSFGGY